MSFNYYNKYILFSGRAFNTRWHNSMNWRTKRIFSVSNPANESVTQPPPSMLCCNKNCCEGIGRKSKYFLLDLCVFFCGCYLIIFFCNSENYLIKSLNTFPNSYYWSLNRKHLQKIILLESLLTFYWAMGCKSFLFLIKIIK